MKLSLMLAALLVSQLSFATVKGGGKRPRKPVEATQTIPAPAPRIEVDTEVVMQDTSVTSNQTGEIELPTFVICRGKGFAEVTAREAAAGRSTANIRIVELEQVYRDVRFIVAIGATRATERYYEVIGVDYGRKHECRLTSVKPFIEK